MPGLAELEPPWPQVDDTVCTLCSMMLSLFMLEALPVDAFPALVLLEALLDEAGVTCPVTATVWFT